MWFDEAGKYDVLPLDDRTAVEIIDRSRGRSRNRSGTPTSTSRTPRGAGGGRVNIRGRSYKILAEVEIDPRMREGVLFAHGSRFGGHSLFIKDRKLWYVYNFLGIPPEQQILVDRAVTPGKHLSAWSSQGEHWRIRRVPRDGQAVRR